MPDRPPLPAGSSWVSPYLTVKDVGAAVDFYETAFGFEKKLEIPGPDDLILHAELTWNGCVIMLGAEGAFGDTTKTPATSGMRPPVGMYVYCDDVDALFAKATQAGARVGSKPTNTFWGDRVCKLIDPDGHFWSFATNVADFNPADAPFPLTDGP